jgi:hypothetical protein
MKYLFSLTSLFTLILLISACSGSSPDQNGASSEQKIKGKTVQTLETGAEYIIQEFEKVVTLSGEQKEEIRKLVVNSGYDIPDNTEKKRALYLKARKEIFENILSPEQKKVLREMGE